MVQYVADTMAIVLWLEKRKMPQLAKNIFNKIESNEVQLYIPAMILSLIHI